VLTVKAQGDGAATGSEAAPKISVVIPTVGRATLRAAIESIRRQSVTPEEIVIVNDSVDQLSVTSELGVDILEEPRRQPRSRRIHCVFGRRRFVVSASSRVSIGIVREKTRVGSLRVHDD
jgi:hypothetical protein